MKFKELRQKIIKSPPHCTIVICPPYTLLRDFAEKVPRSRVELGGQNCHEVESGSYTGEISAAMLRDMNCNYVILGHSERRTLFNESSELVKQKAIAAHKAGLKTILCVGETEQERDQDLVADVLQKQLKESLPECATQANTVIAYEPVWAIGTNQVPKVKDINSAHSLIRSTQKSLSPRFKDIPVIYGGSVNNRNAKTILKQKHVAGVLVGRSSLEPESFWSIVQAADACRVQLVS